MPWALGPPDGRYLARLPGEPPDAPPAHVLVLATLGAPERRMLDRRRTSRDAPPDPDPVPVTTGRATVIDVATALSEDDAAAWLAEAGEDDLAAGLFVLNRALHAFRVVTSDAGVHPVARSQLLVARVGIGPGEDVADGRWSQARELIVPVRRQKRSAALAPQARLAGILTGQERALVCQELTLRSRFDLDHGRPREAALQLLVALDAAIAELSADPRARDLSERLAELRGQRDAVAHAAQTALAGPLGEEDLEAVGFTLHRIEAALRARAVANA